MNNLYEQLELQSANFLQRLFKKTPKENGFIEVNNLLATKPLMEIRVDEIEAIAARYSIDINTGFPEKIKGLYEIYLRKCLEDNFLTDAEVEELKYLKNLLNLKDSDVNDLHDRLCGDIYKRKYEDAIANGVIEQTKVEFINKIQENLKLPDRLITKIVTESRNKLMDLQLGKIIQDDRISPEEWEEFNAIAKNLNVEVDINETTKAKLEKMKLYWLIEKGDIPIKNVDINLQKNENCFYSANIDWMENRTVTERINYGGASYRVKIMKGVYYNAGSVKVQRITSDQLLVIDTGTLYITNKRLIFIGSKKNSNIGLGKILSVTPYADGIGIEKDSGKSPVLHVTDNADILAMILGRVINDL